MNDQSQRFIFDNTDVRGEITHLQQCYVETIGSHQYPAAVAQLLGEFLAAASLLSTTLKFDGTLTLQARSQGQIPLIMAEASSAHKLRAIARDADGASSDQFHTLLTEGQLSITISPLQGQRYQGIVPLDGDNLAQCLESYFKHSEQLSTRIWLGCNGHQSAGMLLQELPASHNISLDQRQLNWQHVTQLANTLSEDELLRLPKEQILHRLYHQEQLRTFDPVNWQFNCSCSHERTLQALKTIGQSELEDIIAEKGSIDINCEFCHQHYHFDQKAISKIFQNHIH
jgi:molecular chaperone Hsp33